MGVGAPVLVVYPTSDFRTSALELQRIDNVVNYEWSGRATYIEVLGVDHFLYTAASQQESFE